jgi:hypothetical protein
MLPAKGKAVGSAVLLATAPMTSLEVNIESNQSKFESGKGTICNKEREENVTVSFLQWQCNGN